MVRIRIACVPKIHKRRDRDDSMVVSIKPSRQVPDLISLLEDGGEQQVWGIIDLGLVLFEVPPLERVVHKICGPSTHPCHTPRMIRTASKLVESSDFTIDGAPFHLSRISLNPKPIPLN